MTADHASHEVRAGFGSRPAVVALAFVWAVTLIALAGLVMWLELSYTPPAVDPVAARTPAPSADVTTDSRTATEIADLPAVATSGIGSDAARAAEEKASDPESTQAAASETGPQAAEIRLVPAPAPDIVESTGDDRMLPIVGSAGRVPWKVYSRPYLGDPEAPKIALVIQGIGLDATQDSAAVERLPPEVVLAISPYSREPQEIAERAREAGHEVLLMLPMEPLEYPANDPGPLTLLVDMPRDELVDRLHRLLGRFQGYVGVVNHMGSRFTAERGALEPVMDDMRRRGLLFLDARTTAESVLPDVARAAGLPVVVNDRYIDNEVSAAAIDEYLGRLLRIAREEGAAVGIGRPYPVTIERIAAFARTLDGSPVVLAPISALVGARSGESQAAAR